MKALRTFGIVFCMSTMTALAISQAPPANSVAQGSIKESAAKDDMAKSKEGEKEKPFEWPKEIGGRKPEDYIKDLNDPDPHIRNVAYQTLPQFGPDVQSLAGRPMVRGLEREFRTAPPAGGDTTVIVAAINAIATLGLANDADIKDACRVLGLLITESPNRTLYRQYAIPALAAFGKRAETGVTIITHADVLQDRSYEIRRLAAGALAHVGQDETRGPALRALEALTGTCIKDHSAAVRVEAFQSLVLLGPPVKPRNPGETKPPEINKEQAARFLSAMKAQLSREKDQQVEAWARLAIMRFDPDKEINDKSLTELAQIIVKGNTMAKFHALNAISLLGERAERQLKTIVEALQNKEPVIVDAAVRALTAMPLAAKQVLPELKARLEARPEPYFHELLKIATKIIEEAKPPGTDNPSDPRAPLPKQ